MQFFYEIFPVFLFFIAFKLYDIYVATVVGIIATLIQVLASRYWLGKWDRKQLVTLGVFVFFGGMTLYFHNPIFVKWKPTVVFWVFALFIIGSQFFTKKPIMQRFMENAIENKGTVPIIVWKKLNISWAVFFIILGGINLYVAYYLSNDAWVNFKFYGITAALFMFSIFQAVYLMRFIVPSGE
ncbi:MAG TPA: septation protein A [Gammaproteobacteria bacterium]|jgi:intracellular septation protein|nr:septation protein A [Gammaproteobacteria bacterium]